MKDLLARYRALGRWVERERRRLKKTGERKSQRFLRRSRLVDDTDPISLRELLRELQTASGVFRDCARRPGA